MERTVVEGPLVERSANEKMVVPFFRGEAVPSRARKSIVIKSFHSNTWYSLEYEKAASVNYLFRRQSSKGLCLPNASEF